MGPLCTLYFRIIWESFSLNPFLIRSQLRTKPWTEEELKGSERRLNPFLIRSQLRTLIMLINLSLLMVGLNPFLIRSQLRTWITRQEGLKIIQSQSLLNQSQLRTGAIFLPIISEGCMGIFCNLHNVSFYLGFNQHKFILNLSKLLDISDSYSFFCNLPLFFACGKKPATNWNLRENSSKDVNILFFRDLSLAQYANACFTGGAQGINTDAVFAFFNYFY